MRRPTPKRIRELLEYDRATGLFRWRKMQPSKTKTYAPGWFKGNKGIRNYRSLWIDKRRYLAHVIAYVIVVGRWPIHEVDHRDRDQANNKWINLRHATRHQNAKNRTVGKNNKTGVRGVTTFGDRFRASIVTNKRYIHLGLYDLIEDAAQVRRAAEQKYYGEFA